MTLVMGFMKEYRFGLLQKKILQHLSSWLLSVCTFVQTPQPVSIKSKNLYHTKNSRLKKWVETEQVAEMVPSPKPFSPGSTG